MRDVFAQVFDNLRAHTLRSVLTMFGILWGVVSVVILSATGEGFQRGNQAVLETLGKNVAIVWGGRTTMQAGGERAGRAGACRFSRRGDRGVGGCAHGLRPRAPWSTASSRAASGRRAAPRPAGSG